MLFNLTDDFSIAMLACWITILLAAAATAVAAAGKNVKPRAKLTGEMLYITHAKDSFVERLQGHINCCDLSCIIRVIFDNPTQQQEKITTTYVYKDTCKSPYLMCWLTLIGTAGAHLDPRQL